jgi:hypothetical protein
MVVPGSAGMVIGSSVDSRDEGTMSPSGEGAVEEGVTETSISSPAYEVSDSCCDGGSSRYPDPLSVSMIPGAPSIESRRTRVGAVTLGLSRAL